MAFNVINWVFTNASGQPLANVQIAILTGTVLGSPEVDASTQPGSPLAPVFADNEGATTLTNPTTLGTNTITTDGSGNLCSSVVVDGKLITTIGVWADTTSNTYFTIQAYGGGIAGVGNQQLIPLSLPTSD